MMGNVLGFKPTFVAYRGSAPAITDLLAGQIDLLWDQVTNAIQQVQSGMLHGIAITSTERLDELKDVPTTAELGMPELNYTMWHGLYVVKGTPKDKIAALNEALRKALADPDVATKLKALGTLPFPAARAIAGSPRKTVCGRFAAGGQAGRELRRQAERGEVGHAPKSVEHSLSLATNGKRLRGGHAQEKTRSERRLLQHLRHDQARQEQGDSPARRSAPQHDEHRDQHDGGVLDRIAQPYARDGTGDHQA